VCQLGSRIGNKKGHFSFKPYLMDFRPENNRRVLKWWKYLYNDAHFFKQVIFISDVCPSCAYFLDSRIKVVVVKKGKNGLFVCVFIKTNKIGYAWPDSFVSMSI